MGVWQPHHGGQYNHHAISLQPNCTMLGYHTLHKLKSYSSPGVSMTPHRGTMQYHIYTYIRTRDFAKLLEPTLPTASLEQVFAYKRPLNLL